MYKVREALVSKGISFEAVSAIIGVHRNSLNNKLNGVTSFTIDEAFKIKNQLLPEYDINYLFSDADAAASISDTPTDTQTETE